MAAGEQEERATTARHFAHPPPASPAFLARYATHAGATAALLRQRSVHRFGVNYKPAPPAVSPAMGSSGASPRPRLSVTPPAAANAGKTRAAHTMDFADAASDSEVDEDGDRNAPMALPTAADMPNETNMNQNKGFDSDDDDDDRAGTPSSGRRGVFGSPTNGNSRFSPAATGAAGTENEPVLVAESQGTVQDDGCTLGELNQYVLLEKLGQGAQGEVFLAMDTAANELRAVKAVQRPAAGRYVSAARRRQLDALMREVAIMKRLRHRNVVALHEVIDDPEQATMYLVLQYVEHGPLATLSPQGTLEATVEPGRLVSYAHQICAGLDYLHRNGVIHRDIKPENILRGANDTVFLADFGVSEQARGRGVQGTRGTPAFLAPELLQLEVEAGDGTGAVARQALEAVASPRPLVASDPAAQPSGVADVRGEPVDVWALGITLYALLYGKLPWEFTDARDLFDAIQRRPIELRPAAAVLGASRRLSSAIAFATVDVNDAAGAAPKLPAPSLDSDHSGAQSPVGAGPSALGCTPRYGLPATMPVPDFLGSPTENDAASPIVPRRLSECLGASALEDSSRPASENLATASSTNTAVQSPQDTRLRSRSIDALGCVPAAIDEGWRRILHGMLQRNPKRRSTLRDVRRQLAQLEKRIEESKSAARRDVAATELASAFTTLQHRR